MTIYLDNAPHVLGSVVTLAILAVVTFGLRVYVRMGKTWGAEDTSMAVGMVSVSTVMLLLLCLLGRPNLNRLEEEKGWMECSGGIREPLCRSVTGEEH